MKTRLLRKIQAHLAEEPKRYVQDYEHITSTETLERVSLNGAPPCGTMACIGGWACVLSGDSSPSYHTMRKAQEYLGLDPEQADRLFSGVSVSEGDIRIVYSGTRWPKKFASAYAKAKTQRGRVAVAIRRIDHFIATRGRD